MKINESTFTIVANGFADGPAQALRDYLIEKGAKQITTISHPLVAENDPIHTVSVYCNGKVTTKKTRLPNKPPYTYVLDPFVPLRLQASNAWFGFNNLAASRGIARRLIGRTDKVYYWAVDFAPKRFGRSLATTVYDKMDNYMCRHVDGRVELSEAALAGRSKYLGMSSSELAPAIVVPMGAWLERTPKVGSKAWDRKKIVYLGHLVERQGVGVLIKALGILMKKDETLSAEIIGSGPLEQHLRQLAKDLGLEERIIFHGFVKDHRDVESILASGTVAAAPYLKDETSFTQFADPGKLKAYLGANLPIVLTNVPPNANELEAAGVAVIVEDTPESVAEGLHSLLADEQQWTEAHAAAIRHAKQYDWATILSIGLKSLDIV